MQFNTANIKYTLTVTGRLLMKVVDKAIVIPLAMVCEIILCIMKVTKWFMAPKEVFKDIIKVKVICLVTKTFISFWLLLKRIKHVIACIHPMKQVIKFKKVARITKCEVMKVSTSLLMKVPSVEMIIMFIRLLKELVEIRMLGSSVSWSLVIISIHVIHFSLLWVTQDFIGCQWGKNIFSNTNNSHKSKYV